MAKLSSDGKYVTVEQGDTLSQIAVDYAGGYSKYKQLAAINNISNPDFIYVGQKIYLTSKGGSSSGSSSTNSYKPTINQFGLQSNANNTLFATWTWTISYTDSYKVSWTYDTGDGVWFEGSSGTISVDDDNPSLAKQSTYSIPSNAKRVQFKVKPISKTYEKNDTETKYWEASWSDTETWTVTTYFPLEIPGSAPSVEIEKFKLTASLDNVNITNATHIEFQVVRDNLATPFATKQASIVTSHASYAFTINAGSEYKVRCRAYNSNDKTYSDWTEYSSNKGTIPSAPESIKELKALSETSVQISWSSVTTATGYGIEYTTDKMYFDSSSEVKSVTVGDNVTTWIITGMDSGDEYFFRVKATNSEGDSGWSEIKSIVIGKPPAAPTTWSSTTTAIVGDPVTLYWVHNAEDESNQTYAELQLYVDGNAILPSYTLTGDKTRDDNYITYTPLTEEEQEDRKNHSCTLKTSLYSEGSVVKWEIRTAGATKEFGDWSVRRTVTVYAPPTLELSMTDTSGNAIETLTSFPFIITGVAGPKTQNPIGYHLSVVSDEQYETTDNIGNAKIVNAGEEIYSKYFDTIQKLSVEMSPGVIDLENNIHYTVTCTVSMDSGLTADSSVSFVVAWSDEQHIPNAEIGIDEETMTANIRPYCEDSRIVHYQVNYTGGKYVKTTTELGSVYGTIVKRAVTTTDEKVYYGASADADNIYYCSVEEKTPVDDVLLSVYRREFDGSFTELATGLDSAKKTTITDPHPALDYARYRVVATTKSTGAVGYYDLPGYPVGAKAAIIQWDEAWSSFDTSEEDPLEQPVWSGSMLKLPYNIDVTESHSPDMSLVEYAGRSHPVGYYGTQLGVTASWSMEIPKEDKETLYGLRRLARWMGDVYVREPSGSGYWANITVSFNQKHCEVTIPVSLSISQVEGGI